MISIAGETLTIPTTAKASQVPNEDRSAETRKQTQKAEKSNLKEDSGTAAVAKRPATVEPWTEDLKRACDVAQRERQRLLMFLTLDGCVYCKRMKKETLADKGIASEIQDQFVTVIVNATKRPDIAKRLRVRTFPTTLVFSSDGDIIETMRGYKTPKQFRMHLATAAAESQTVRR